MTVIVTQKPMVPTIEVVEQENRVVFEFGAYLREYNFSINVTEVTTAKVLGDLQFAVENNTIGEYFKNAISSNILIPHPDNPELSEPILFSLDIGSI